MAPTTQLADIPKSSNFTINTAKSADSNIFYVTYHQEQFAEETSTITVGDGMITQGTVKQMSLYISYNIQRHIQIPIKHLRRDILRK